MQTAAEAFKRAISPRLLKQLGTMHAIDTEDDMAQRCRVGTRHPVGRCGLYALSLQDQCAGACLASCGMHGSCGPLCRSAAMQLGSAP